MNKAILIILLITTLNLNAQTHFIGIKGGVNWTNVTSTNFPSNINYRTGLSSGLTYEYLTMKHFSFSMDFFYNQRGFTNDIIFINNLVNPSGQKVTCKSNYDYFSVPIKAAYNIGGNIYGFINIGVSPSFLINAKYESPIINSNNKFAGKETIDVTDKATRFDLVGLIEIGGAYKLTDKLILFSSFAYQRSFIAFSNSEYLSNSKAKHYGMSLSLGLKYDFMK